MFPIRERSHRGCWGQDYSRSRARLQKEGPGKILAQFRLKVAIRASYLVSMELSPYLPAALATEGHVFCVGTLAQCLRRWNRLPNHSKAEAYLKMGRDGVPPTILRGEQISELASNARLIPG